MLQSQFVTHLWHGTQYMQSYLQDFNSIEMKLVRYTYGL